MKPITTICRLTLVGLTLTIGAGCGANTKINLASDQVVNQVTLTTTEPSTITPAGQTSNPLTPAEQEEVIVTRDDPSLPPGCSPREVARLISAFFTAFEQGDPAQVARFVHPHFHWYMVNESAANEQQRHFVAYTWDELRPYFAERLAQGERLRLHVVDMSVSEETAFGSRVHVSYKFTRHAPDLLGEPDHKGIGGAAILCEPQQFYVSMLSSGPVLKDHDSGPPLCPLPPAGSSPNAIIACVRAHE